ncbi:MAG: PEP-CTERM sorting domain-containing protein [Planctomycetota bacterium]
MRILAVKCLSLAAVLLAAGPAHAIELTIDPSQSTMTLDSTSFSPFMLPGTTKPDGDATSLSGSLSAQITSDSFQLLDGSVLVADDHGAFLPGVPSDMGTPAPASFAFSYPSAAVTGVDLEVAIRHMTLSMIDAAPRSLTGGVLGAGVPDFAVLSGEGHLNVGNPPVTPLPVYTVTTLSSEVGSYSLSGDLLSVMIPFEVDVSVGGASPSTTIYSGQIVASGTVPEPAASCLAAIALAAAGFLRWRRG